MTTRSSSYRRDRPYLPKQRKPRPLSVTVLSIMVLISAVVNLARFTQAIKSWDTLVTLLPFNPLYLVLSGLFWGVSGIAVSLLIWSGWSGSPWAAIVYWGLYSLYGWADRLFLPGYPERNSNWLFVLVMQISMLALSSWILFRPKARRFFEALNE